MFIHEFLQTRLESSEFFILYDKSMRNTPDLQAKETDAYFKLIDEIETNFHVEMPLSGVIDMVKEVLETSKYTNQNGPSTSSNVNSDETAQVLAALNDCLGDLADNTNASNKDKNSSAHYQTFVKHRKTKFTPIEKKKITNLPITETFSQTNKREIKNLEKRLKKMEQKFNETCRLMSEEQSKKDSGSYLLLFEYFAKVDMNRCDDLDKEVLSEIQSWYPES